MPKRFNDVLALVLVGGSFLLWMGLGRGWLAALPAEVTNTVANVFLLVAYHYFRKMGPKSET